MIRPFTCLAIILFSSFCWIACGPKMYRSENRIYHGRLRTTAYDSLRQILSLRSPRGLMDTIMIKYDYNNKTCWYVLDMQEDSYIRRIITSFNNYFQMLVATRPGISAFTFREPGNRVNKLKKWDKTILIDSSKQLLHLLFKERVNCGSGIVVLPDRNFVFIRSDSHADIFRLTKEQIGQLLTKGNTP